MQSLHDINLHIILNKLFVLQWEAYLLLFILHRAARENADTICHSFQKKLPKIASKLKTLNCMLSSNASYWGRYSLI